MSLYDIENILGGSADFLIKIGEKFDTYKNRAKKNKTEFRLSFPQFDYLVKSNCHYCGISPSNEPLGVDRADNKKGYIWGNCVPSCWTCNRAKSNSSYGEFMEYLNRFKNEKVKKKSAFRNSIK